MKILKYAILAFILFVLVAGPAPESSAQSTTSGTWKSDSENWKINSDWDDKEKKTDQIQISFKRVSPNGNWMNGSGFDLKDLQGLTREQIEGPKSAVRFQIVREAGTVSCEGTFGRKSGSGNWNFTPNKSFSEAMKSRGFSFNEEKQLTAALLDVTVALADDIRSAGFKNLDADDLFKAKIFKIDSTYMKEMAATGFPGLGMEDLVKARIFKIDADYVKEVGKMGFARDSIEDLVKLRIFKITPEYLGEMKSIGFRDLDVEQAIQLQIFKVTSDFVNEMKKEGFTSLSVEQVVKLKIFKIDGDYVRRAKASRGIALDIEDLVNLKIYGKVK